MGFLRNLFEFDKNFKYLDNLIHSGVKEIILDSDINLSDREKSKYSEGIKLDVDDLVIDGNGHTIDAKGKTRIFDCTGKNIFIKNIVLKSGFVDGSGGAINNRGTLSMKNTTLQENEAEINGGAIFNYMGRLTIMESTIIGNTARDGGAINSQFADELIITKSTIAENVVKHDGGAITNYKGQLTITESTFTGNTAKHYGGAIDNIGRSTITESTFTGNTAKSGGGVIYNNEGSFKVNDCEFSNNNCSESIINNNDYFETINGIFRDNHAANIFSNEGEGTISISYGEFIYNDVSSIVFNGGKLCTIEKSIFKRNKIWFTILNRSDMTLINPKLIDEKETILNQGYLLIKSDVSGNLINQIHNEGTLDSKMDLIPEETKFDFGYLDKKIHESTTKEIILNHDFCFERYEMDFYEGGIELDINDLVIDGNGHIIDGANKSRIFIITGNNITLKNITFKNGQSHKNYDNPFNNSGGAIKNNHNLNLIIEQCKFTNNKSEKVAGAIHNRGGTVTITKSTLTDNAANSCGGAIHNQHGELTIVESTLIANTAEIGGAICNTNGGDLTITESTLTDNTAEEWFGGAINNDGELIIGETIIRGNTAHRGGGAIRNNEGNLTIIGSVLQDNSAGDGGAIDNFGGELTIIGSALHGNSADVGSGGAIDNNGGRLTIKESELNNNKAHKNGGAILLKNADLTMTESLLQYNSGWRGGAIYLEKSTKYVSDNCIFKDNTLDDVYEED